MGLFRWIQWQVWEGKRTEVSQQGERVASIAERRIADLLSEIGIKYQHEAKIAGYRPDFYIPGWKLIIEFWGMDPPGSAHRRKKVGAYLRAGFDVVNIESEDWPHIEDVLLRKLYRWDQGVYRRYKAARRTLG